MLAARHRPGKLPEGFYAAAEKRKGGRGDVAPPANLSLYREREREREM